VTRRSISGAAARWGASRPVECGCVPAVFSALTEPVVFHILPNNFLPDEILLFKSAAKEWETAVKRLRPAVSFSVVEVAPPAGATSVEVSIDPTINAPGKAQRLTGQWWIKLNPALYQQTGPRYLRRLMLHEIGHIVGLDNTACLRTQAVMGVLDWEGIYRGGAPNLTKSDLCGLRNLYPTP
jgi:hypothetical protein